MRALEWAINCTLNEENNRGTAFYQGVNATAVQVRVSHGARAKGQWLFVKCRARTPPHHQGVNIK